MTDKGVAAVSGVSGAQGRKIAEVFRAAGFHVRALTRNAAHVAELERFSFDAVQIDGESIDAWARALDGASVLVLPATTRPGR